MQQYLLVECANVEQVLKESLRYRYVEKAAADYYDECARRLRSIKRRIESTDNALDLQSYRSQLSTLSKLITHIERSHLEEFSWPFADSLARISKGVCTQAGPALGEPLFFFMAEGGPASYAVRRDEQQLDAMRRQIYSVFFPRTLKDHVLLHAIFGHEIGHAALHVRPEIFDALDALRSGSEVLKDGQKLYEWCRANIHVDAAGSNEYLKEQAKSWTEEILSDIFGLIMMGPSFLSAFQALLEPAHRIQGIGFVPSHPPYSSRAVVLLHAARKLGLLFSDVPESEMKKLSKALDEAFVRNASRYCGTPLSIVEKDAVEIATEKLFDILGKFPDLRYPLPSAATISALVDLLADEIPPVATSPATDADDDVVGPGVIDFRHIIHAGWIRVSELKKPELLPELFSDINRLCAHAILQQEGIRTWSGGSLESGAA
jgi:hypothetical protein